MEQEVLFKLKENLFKRYSDFNKENLFIEIDADRSFINVYNYVCMDNYINYNKVELIKRYMFNFLKKHKQEGFFYICDYAINLNKEVKA